MVDKDSLLRAAFPEADPDSSTAYYGSVGDIYQALMFSDLFWPTCFVIRGAVFLGVGANSPEWVSEGIDEVLARGESESRSWVETVDSFNWFEVPYLFGQLRNPLDRQGEASEVLAAILCECWAARLKQLFPDRQFRVHIRADGPEALNVTVKQVAPDLVLPTESFGRNE
jgi:hypothetical protein